MVDEKQRLTGIFTDGDLRRILDKRIDIHTTQIGEVMIANPTSVSPELLAAEGVNIMQEKSINGLLLCNDDGELVGALNMLDMLRAGVM